MWIKNKTVLILIPQKKKEQIFSNVCFVLRKSVWHLYVIPLYRVLNKLSEHVWSLHTFFCLFLKFSKTLSTKHIMLFYFHKKCFRKSQLYQEFLVRQEEDKGLFSKMQYLLIFFYWDSFHARLNSHYKARSYKKKKNRKIKAYRESF